MSCYLRIVNLARAGFEITVDALTFNIPDLLAVAQLVRAIGGPE
jgi:hypothetical protein